MLRHLFTIVIAFNFFQTYSQEIKWVTLEEALIAQKIKPKKIIMDVYTDWCGPCKLMDKNTFGNTDLAAYVNEYYYAVKFNAEGNETINFYDYTFKNPNYDPNRKGKNSTHQFTQFLGVTGYPTTIFLSELGDLITPVVGYHTAQQLELYLKMIKQGDYQVFTSAKDFENYKKYFKPKFRIKSKKLN
ncbi:MAG: thioredoxin family protein [Flavobacteriaceae bacterium]|nr:thioredoxin family protein [Flavobacteriaceae bacterium]|tara:strand:+ start:2536 stop:3096 length:561 start_codon:yes stop_codon:yes gene_type:complete